MSDNKDKQEREAFKAWFDPDDGKNYLDCWMAACEWQRNALSQPQAGGTLSDEDLQTMFVETWAKWTDDKTNPTPLHIVYARAILARSTADASRAAPASEPVPSAEGKGWTISPSSTEQDSQDKAMFAREGILLSAGAPAPIAPAPTDERMQALAQVEQHLAASSERRKERAARLGIEATAPAVQADYEVVLADHRRLVRELDVLLNGDAAAKQASLCGIVAQVRKEGIRSRQQSVTQPECADQFERIDMENHRLRQGMKKLMARLTTLLDEDQFADCESIVKGVGVEPPADTASEAWADARDAAPIGYMNERAASILAQGSVICTHVSPEKTQFQQVAIYKERV